MGRDEAEMQLRDFPGGPVVKTLHFHCRGCGFDPWSGKMPHGMAKKFKKKKKKTQLREAELWWPVGEKRLDR